MKIVCYKGKGRQPWRWRFVARNGRVVADGAEGYATKSSLSRAVKRLDRMIPALVARAIEWK